MFDPETDLTEIYKILSADSTLLTLLGWASPQLKTDYIWKGDQAPQPTSGKNKLCFYHVPSRSSVNDLTSFEVVQFDAHVPIASPQSARNIQHRVRDLLHRKVINTHEFWFAGQQGNIPTATGYTCMAVRYRYLIVT